MASKRQTVPQVQFLRAETNLFEDVSYDVSIQNTTTATYYPLHSIDSKSSPIQFNITGNYINYLNLAESKLYLRCKIVDKDGRDIPYEADKAKSSYAPINNLLHSMFDNVTVHINDIEVTPKSNYYQYRSFIETLLAKGKDYKKSQARAAMYFQTTDEDSVEDKGWTSRRDIVDKSSVFELIGRPHLDILHQIKLFPPGVDIKLTFYRAEDSFFLQTAGTEPLNNLQIKILEAQYFVTKHTILPTLMVNQLKQWESGQPVAYPMREVQLKSYTLPAGTISHYNESLVTGNLPDRILIGLVDAKNIHGNYATNPLAFKDYGLSNISVTCNSEEVTSFSLDVDFANSRYVRAYSALFENLGIADCDSGIELTMEEYRSSKTLFAFDLRHLRNAFCVPRHGSVLINLKFKQAITDAITVICYLEYQSVLYINSDRQVYFRDFSKQY